MSAYPSPEEIADQAINIFPEHSYKGGPLARAADEANKKRAREVYRDGAYWATRYFRDHSYMYLTAMQIEAEKAYSLQTKEGERLREAYVCGMRKMQEYVRGNSLALKDEPVQGPTAGPPEIDCEEMFSADYPNHNKRFGLFWDGYRACYGALVYRGIIRAKPPVTVDPFDELWARENKLAWGKDSDAYRIARAVWDTARKA